MTRIAIFLTGLVCAAALFAAGAAMANENAGNVVPSRNYTTVTTDVGFFDKISASGKLDVICYPGSTRPTVEIFAPDNIVPHISVSDKEGALFVKMASPDGSPLRLLGECKIEVRVYSSDVTEYRATADAEIQVFGSLRTSANVFMCATDHAEIDLENYLECAGLTIRSRDDAEVSLGNVECKSLDADVTRHSDLSIDRLSCQGAVQISAVNNADVEIEHIDCYGPFSAICLTRSSIEIEHGRCVDPQYNTDVTSEIKTYGVSARGPQRN